MAFLPVSSSLPPAQQHFRMRVILSQQRLMYIWPLMLSLHVPKPKAQLKPSRHPSRLSADPVVLPFAKPFCAHLHIFSVSSLPCCPPPVCSSPLSLASYYAIVTGHKAGLLCALLSLLGTTRRDFHQLLFYRYNFAKSRCLPTRHLSLQSLHAVHLWRKLQFSRAERWFLITCFMKTVKAN